MEIIINISTRKDRRALVVENILVREAHMKEPDEVISEVLEQIESAIEEIYSDGDEE